MVPFGMANMAKPSVSTAGVRPSVSIMSFLVAAKGSGSSAMACQVMPVVCMVASPFGLGWESGLESLDDAVGDLGEVGDVDVGGVVERWLCARSRRGRAQRAGAAVGRRRVRTASWRRPSFRPARFRRGLLPATPAQLYT